MATIKKQVLGIPTGKVGDLLYKNRRGKSYLAAMPGKYKKTKSPGAVKNRSRFGVLSRFASAVNDSPFLKPLWNLKSLPGKSPYTKCFKYNSAFSKSNYAWSMAIITPRSLHIKIESVELNPSSVNIGFRFNNDTTEIFSNPFIAVTIIFCKDVRKPEKIASLKDPLFVTLEKEVLDFQPDREGLNNVSYNLKKGSLSFLDKYENIMTYTSFISRENINGEFLFTTGFAVPYRGFDEIEEFPEYGASVMPKPEPVSSFRIK